MDDSSGTREDLLAEIRALKADLAELKASRRAADADRGVDQSRLEAEESLRESEERFRSVAEKSPSMIFINQGGRVVYANPRSEELLDYTVEELCAPDFDFRSLIAPESAEIVSEMFARHARGEEIEQYEYTLVTKDGRRTEVINATRLIRYGGKPAILGVVTDISDLVRTRRALEESERLYRTLIETCPDSIVLVGLDGTFLMANDEAARHQGFRSAEELLAQAPNSFSSLAPEDRARTMGDLRQVLTEGRVAGAVFETVGVDGCRAIRESNASLIRDSEGNPKAIMAVTRDITERRRVEEERLQLERQVLHAQKLESLGILAGGIAHDFNNLLTGILGSASLALRCPDDRECVAKNVERIRAAARRAAELTRQMLAYSGRGAFEVRPVRVDALVGEIGELLEASIPKTARLRIAHGVGLPQVLADRAQLQQVVMNLLTNAGEAVGAAAGEIAIRTGVVRPNPALLEDSRLTGTLADREHVYIEVADTGCGMDAATRERMFEPFFTTKFAGRGLGLAAVIGIVQGHGGAILVDSEPGAGSTVRVYLPADSEAASTEQTPVEESDEHPMTGTVLIADDEELVRAVAADMLTAMGLRTLTAVDGKQAVELFRARAEEIDAILLDLTMPELSGEAALRAIRAIRPDVPIVLASGFDEREVARRFEGLGVIGFAQKPFQMRKLRRLMRLALEVRDA